MDEIIETFVEEGEEVGFYSWLYDEDKWPSGFAGGTMPAKNEEYRAKTLIMIEFEKSAFKDHFTDASIIAIFDASLGIRLG
ncbi:MAG: hypothetical protein FGF52_03325 [Candidatus Brockarchaeota archaeon]|nr:hypothetical protein [Candidatus Brockarchaeota archaeon]